MSIPSITSSARRGLLLCGKLMASVFNGIEFGGKEPSLVQFNEFLLPFRQSMKEFLQYCCTHNTRLVRKPGLTISIENSDSNLAEQYVSLKTPLSSPSKTDLLSSSRMELPTSPSRSDLSTTPCGEALDLVGASGAASKSIKYNLKKKPVPGVSRSVVGLFGKESSPAGETDILTQLDTTAFGHGHSRSNSQLLLDSPKGHDEETSTVKLLKKKTMSIKNLFSPIENTQFTSGNDSMSILSNTSDEGSKPRARNPTKSIKNLFLPQQKVKVDAELVEFVEELRKIEGVLRTHFTEFGKKLPNGESREQFILRFEEWIVLLKEFDV